MRRIPSSLWHFALDYIDVFLAGSLALLFTYLGARNQLKGDDLTQATVALLAVLSLVILRERWERRKIVDSVDQAVAAIGSERPWHVLSDALTWDIRKPEPGASRKPSRPNI